MVAGARLGAECGSGAGARAGRACMGGAPRAVRAAIRAACERGARASWRCVGGGGGVGGARPPLRGPGAGAQPGLLDGGRAGARAGRGREHGDLLGRERGAAEPDSGRAPSGPTGAGVGGERGEGLVQAGGRAGKLSGLARRRGRVQGCRRPERHGPADAHGRRQSGGRPGRVGDGQLLRCDGSARGAGADAARGGDVGRCARGDSAERWILDTAVRA